MELIKILLFSSVFVLTFMMTINVLLQIRENILSIKRQKEIFDLQKENSKKIGELIDVYDDIQNAVMEEKEKKAVTRKNKKKENEENDSKAN